jgi:hypothetical protein
MRTPVELLIELHNMFENGQLAAEFDNRRNKMINSETLVLLMSEVKEHIPSRLEPKQAADARHEEKLEDKEREEAIKAADTKVIDMRKEFLLKMSENGGALGLTKKLMKAVEENDLVTIDLVTMDMQELVKQSD